MFINIMVQLYDIVDADLIWYHCKNELYNLLILYSLIIFIFSINKLIKFIFTRSRTEIILLNILLYLCFRNYLSNNIFNELQINDYNITHSNNIFIKLKVIESKYNDIIKSNEHINTIQNEMDIIKNKYKVLPDINKVNDIIKSNKYINSIQNDIDIIKKNNKVLPDINKVNDIIKSNKYINSIQNDMDIIKNKYKVLPDINKVNDIIKSNLDIKNDIIYLQNRHIYNNIEHMISQSSTTIIDYNIKHPYLPGYITEIKKWTRDKNEFPIFDSTRFSYPQNIIALSNHWLPIFASSDEYNNGLLKIHSTEQESILFINTLYKWLYTETGNKFIKNGQIVLELDVIIDPIITNKAYNDFKIKKKEHNTKYPTSPERETIEYDSTINYLELHKQSDDKYTLYNSGNYPTNRLGKTIGYTYNLKL